MFRKLTNVEMLNLKIGAETQDKKILSPSRRKGYRRLSLPNFKIQSKLIDFVEQNDNITHSRFSCAESSLLLYVLTL